MASRHERMDSEEICEGLGCHLGHGLVDSAPTYGAEVPRLTSF